MSLLSSIVTLGIVAGFGWFTIYYLIPKLEAGELGAAGLKVGENASAGSGGEESLITDELMDVLTGQESGTTEALPEEEPAPEPVAEPEKKKKGKGEWLSSDKAGQDNRKKKKRSEQNLRIIQYLYD